MDAALETELKARDPGFTDLTSLESVVSTKDKADAIKTGEDAGVSTLATCLPFVSALVLLVASLVLRA